VILQLLLTRTPLGLHMRAASMDFRTARLLGVRANRVISGAVIVSGIFAAVAAVMLSVTELTVVPTFGTADTIYVLAGVVLGGLTRPVAATLGGFSIGFANGILGGVLPSNQSQYLPSILFAMVIVVLLVRPNGLFTRGAAAVERV
jgi:branched-chain amino acid transport system permease protein